MPCTHQILRTLHSTKLDLADPRRFALSPDQLECYALSHAIDVLEFKKLGLAVIDEHCSCAFPPHPDVSDLLDCASYDFVKSDCTGAQLFQPGVHWQ